jgi:RecJ-like exonuclease
MVKGLEDLVPPGLLDRARTAASLVDGVSRVRILCHYDPDGTTSAAILARALLRRSKRIHATMAHALDRETADRVKAEPNELVVVSDMGSAQLDLLEAFSCPVIVLDHHKPLRDSERVAHVNPHFFGIDGAREMCGATISWLFTLALDEANWDLAGLAAAGAIGDKQNIGGFSGANAALFGEAVERKVLVPERRLALRDRPLAQALAISISPYFRGIGGRPEAAEVFLRAVGIDPAAALRQLDATQRRRLSSVLATRLLEQGAAPEALDVLVEDRYWIEPDQMYAQDLEAYVNGCDRLEQMGLGMAVCLGDREALHKAEVLLDEYTAKVLSYLKILETESLFTKKHIQFFYCEEPSLAGSVAGAGIHFYFDQSRPVLGLSVMEGHTKVSARGTRTQIAQGVDLAVALRDAADAVEGDGGGHDIASGATIPKGKEEKFLGLVDDLVGRQITTPRTPLDSRSVRSRL